MKTFDERKQKVLATCNIEYANRKFSWWKQRQKVYKSTLEVALSLNGYTQTSTSIVVRKNFRIELLWFVATFIFGVSFVSLIFPSGSLFIKIFMPALFIGFLTYQFVRMIDKKPKIILTDNDFWFYKMESAVLWENLIVSAIKKEQRGNNTFNVLIIHYYDATTDNFAKIEFDYFNLEMEIDEICFHIEKFKEKNIHNVRE